MNDHRRLRDIFIGSQKLRAKILSHSRYKTLPALNSRYNKKGNDRYLWSGVKTFTPCPARTIIFKRESVNYLIASFTRCTLPFQCVCFLLPICLPCVSCGTYCNAHKCCVVTHRAADIRVALLDLNSCLRSHVLRAHCNFESKQANLITLFGRRPNNNRKNCLGER